MQAETRETERIARVCSGQDWDTGFLHRANNLKLFLENFLCVIASTSMYYAESPPLLHSSWNISETAIAPKMFVCEICVAAQDGQRWTLPCLVLNKVRDQVSRFLSIVTIQRRRLNPSARFR